MSMVSVIVPVYNVEKYLSKCVESILNQTYSDLEIILVDDGSTDNSGAICDKFKNNDSRIRVFHTENHGLSCARNYGLEQSKGEFVAFIDSDDYIYNSFIEDLYGMCVNTGSDISQCDFLFVKEESPMLCEQNHTKEETISGREAVYRCCKQPNAVKYNVAWNKLYRRKLFESIRYPAGRIHEDEFTSYKLFFEANKVTITNKYMHCYLQRKDSITDSKFDLRKIDRIDAYQERLNFLKTNSLNKAYDAFLGTFYQTLCGVIKKVADSGIDNSIVSEKLSSLKKSLENEIWNNASKSFNEKLRLVYPNLSDEEREIYKRLHVSDNLYNKTEMFICPFGIIPKGSNIVIYGAGKVGQEYYRQIVNCDYANIVDWVDNGWKSKVIKGVDVHPINNLLVNDFDYVLIGIKEIDLALEIKENLISWGIEENKILWKSPLCVSVGDAGDIAFRKKVLVEETNISKNKKIIIFNTPEHGNLGDHALAIAAIDFANKFFSEYEIMEVSGKIWDYLDEEIVDAVGEDDVLFIVGGGYMGSVWPKEDNRVKNFVKRFPKNKIFFLPQTFYYETDDGDDKLFWSNLQNVYYIHRENISYEYFTENIVNNKEHNALFPDMVLSLQYEKPDDKRQGVGLCFRTDKEGVVSKDVLEKLECELIQKGITVNLTDTVLKENVNAKRREEELKKKLDEFSSYELIVTDRLHGMIFATITHTPCVALNNKTGKVFGVYQWIKKCPYINIIESESLNSSFISECCQRKFDTAFQLDITYYFEEMAEWIKQLIKV